MNNACISAVGEIKIDIVGMHVHRCILHASYTNFKIIYSLFHAILSILYISDSFMLLML